MKEWIERLKRWNKNYFSTDLWMYITMILIIGVSLLVWKFFFK